MKRLLFVFAAILLTATVQAKKVKVTIDGTVSPSQTISKQHDDLIGHQLPLQINAYLSANNSQRVGCSRVFRLHPTNDGKPSRTSACCRWTDSHNHSLHVCLLLRRLSLGRWAGISSPRSYYVIALRRIIC